MARGKGGLGRGLDSLFEDAAPVFESEHAAVETLPLREIEPDPDQPRKTFEQETLSELAASIAEHGLLQPIAVRPRPMGGYSIVAGERRWRASRMAGLTEVPVVIKDVSDEQAMELALVENLQRADLNPIEEASGYRDLIDAFGLTQEEAARRVGKSRASVANMLRLLTLPQKVQDLCIDGSLTYGHARSLLPLCGVLTDEAVCACADTVVRSGLSVRETERYVKLLLEGQDKTQPGGQSLISRTYYKQLESKAGGILGRRVTIRRKPNGSGSLALAYSSADDLERLMKSLCGDELFSEEE